MASSRVLVVLGVLVLAGCGAEKRTAPPAPRLPHALGARLAERADAISAQLERGDGCAAARLAAGLRSEALAAVNAGSVPARLQETLVGSVQDLAGRIVCVPPPPPAAPPAAPPDEHEQKDKHGKKGRGHGGEGDN